MSLNFYPESKFNKAHNEADEGKASQTIFSNFDELFGQLQKVLTTEPKESDSELM